MELVVVRFNANNGGKYNEDDDWCVEWSADADPAPVLVGLEYNVTLFLLRPTD